MAEFDLIRQLQQRICAADAPWRSSCRVGIGDDAAVLESPAGRQFVVCTDSLVQAVHFPVDTPAAAVGHKALAVNLSDLAAMGAEPAWFFLSLTLPEPDTVWLEGFMQGMAALARECGIYLAGGDLSSGPLNVCVAAIGLVDTGCYLTRSGAAAGDLIAVSGRPGAAAHALDCLKEGRKASAADRLALEFPTPRIALGQCLPGVASACIDLSDGLLADLGHIMEASAVGAVLELSSLPCPASLAPLPECERWSLQLSGGDDYELCFTLPPGSSDRLDEIRRRSGVELTVIGQITDDPGLSVRAPDGSDFEPARSGYEHFRGAGG